MPIENENPDAPEAEDIAAEVLADESELDDATDPEAEPAEDEPDEDEGEGDTGGDASAAGSSPAPSRRTIRVQKLEKERDEAKTREITLQARLDAILAERNKPDDRAAQAAEQARVAAMDPIERERYHSEQRIARLEATINNLAHNQSDALDKVRFEQYAKHPVFKKYVGEIETTLQGMRKAGVNSDREAILKYKMGEALYNRVMAQDTGKGARKQAAGDRVNAVRGKPANARGDSTGTRAGKTEEDRLRGVQI